MHKPLHICSEGRFAMKMRSLYMAFSLSLWLVPMGDAIAQTRSSVDLFAAVKAGNVEEVSRLLASGADSKVRDDRGAAPLQWAAVLGSKEIAPRSPNC